MTQRSGNSFILATNVIGEMYLAKVNSLTCDELADVLKKKGFHDACDFIIKRRIDGRQFLNLDKLDLRRVQVRNEPGALLKNGAPSHFSAKRSSHGKVGQVLIDSDEEDAGVTSTRCIATQVSVDSSDEDESCSGVVTSRTQVLIESSDENSDNDLSSISQRIQTLPPNKSTKQVMIEYEDQNCISLPPRKSTKQVMVGNDKVQRLPPKNFTKQVMIENEDQNCISLPPKKSTKQVMVANDEDQMLPPKKSTKQVHKEAGGHNASTRMRSEVYSSPPDPKVSREVFLSKIRRLKNGQPANQTGEQHGAPQLPPRLQSVSSNQTKLPPPENTTKVLRNRTHSLERHPNFKQITKEDGTKLLRKMNTGHFLLRPSNMYFCTIMVKVDTLNIYNIPLMCSEGFYYLVTKGDEAVKKFARLSELIDFHKIEPIITNDVVIKLK